MNALPTSLQNDADKPVEPSAAQRRRRRRVVLPAVVVVVAGLGIAYVITGPLDDGKAGDTGSVAPTGTATITKGRLSARTSVNGTLSFAGSYQAINQGSGTYTKLPKTGRVYRQGEVLYRVDGKPVIFLEGASSPFYRDLKRGLSGTDVRQLNAALVALGHTAGGYLDPRSKYFGWATEDALQDLQDDLGLDDTGTLTRRQAVFLPKDKVRITSVPVTSGTAAKAGEVVVKAGSTERTVTVAVDAAMQSQVKEGDNVTITLPNMKSTPGVVTSVGTVAKKTSTGGATITVRIRPTDEKATGTLDQAPVGVSIVTESVEDVLAVPVNALLALLNGGYGVELVEANGARRIVPVTLGLFDNTSGTVQVSGKDLAAGRRVVVPAS
ncbi:peptidoglycan-binding protein [Actinomadura rugatobispora]|uniref:Peptidoglycan-binding protein n=1 Tax=Actinomadura rugatobispora TaxID=1994 RepID=A0ABW1AHX9_9ACTN|nr:hypothetical protein GCM10010200_021350 [Actinomadura rugatobispora]